MKMLNGSSSVADRNPRPDAADDWVVAAARVRASITHPHLIRARFQGTSRPPLVVELCSGPTLAEEIEEGPLPADDAVGVIMAVASAVDALAAHGLAPRELSPEAVHLHHTRGAVLADAGVPASLQPRAQVVSKAASDYLSPEELSGVSPTPRSLVYTLGAILGDSVEPDAPRSLMHVIDRATAPYPQARYNTPNAFACAAARATRGVKAPAPLPLRPQRRPSELPTADAAALTPRKAPTVDKPAKSKLEPARERVAKRPIGARLAQAAELLRGAKLPGAATPPRLSAPDLARARASARTWIRSIRPASKRPIGARLAQAAELLRGVKLPRAAKLPRLSAPDLARALASAKARIRAIRPASNRVTAIGLALLAAAGCAAIALRTTSGEPGAADRGPVHVGSEQLALSLPAGWRESPDTGTGGLALLDAVAAAPSDEGDPQLVAGLAPVPAQAHRLVRKALADGGTPRQVRLGALEAWRWEDARIGGVAATLFVGYTSRGPLVAICRATPDASSASTPCSVALKTLRLAGPTPATLASVERSQRHLGSELATLSRERIAGRRALANAPIAQEQAEAAQSLETSFTTAAQALAATPAPRGTTDFSGVVAALDRTADAYGALSEEILGGDFAGFDAARQRIIEEEARLRTETNAAAIPWPG